MGKMKNLAIKIAEENIDSLYRDANAEMLFIKGMDTEQQQRVMHEEQLLENKIDEDRQENQKWLQKPLMYYNLVRLV